MKNIIFFIKKGLHTLKNSVILLNVVTLIQNKWTENNIKIVIDIINCFMILYYKSLTSDKVNFEN